MKSDSYAVMCELADSLIGVDEIVEGMMGDHTDPRVPKLRVIRQSIAAMQELCNQILPGGHDTEEEPTPPNIRLVTGGEA